MAQTGGTGTIPGIITDPAGSVVPLAEIKVANVDTGETRTLLAPRSYRADISKEGFRQTGMPVVRVIVTEIESLNVRLEAGALNEHITIEAEQLQTGSSVPGRVSTRSRWPAHRALSELRNSIQAIRQTLGRRQLASIVTIQPGQRMAIHTNEWDISGISNDRAQIGPGCSYPQLVTSGSNENHLTNWFNTSCITTPPVIGDDKAGTTFKNMGMGVVRGPGQANLQAVDRQYPARIPGGVLHRPESSVVRQSGQPAHFGNVRAGAGRAGESPGHAVRAEAAVLTRLPRRGIHEYS